MATNRIKGITIEIEGNTTKLQTALGDVNKDLKTTQTNLRDVNKLLKLDPKNTELLTQKQDLLKKAIEDTKKKLETEKEALRQLKEADQTPEVIAQQAALQREIAADEASLGSLKGELSSVAPTGMQAFFAVGEQIKEVGHKITEVGETLTQKITVPLAALAGASIAAFKSVDDGYDEMIKKTGATGEEADKLREIMENIATEIPTDFQTAGAAIGEVSTRFGVTGDELENLSGLFIKFADLNNTDVSNSIDKVQKALAAYGKGADYADNLLDRLNKTGQETGISVDKLADGIVTNVAAFQEMGLTIDESVNFMGQLEKSSADVDTVMGGLRKALKNATSQGIPLNDALSDLQDTILNGKDGVDGLTAAYDLFGKSGDQIYAAVQNGTLDFTALGVAVSDAGGSINDTFAETEDPLDEFAKTLNELKLVGAELGEAILDTLAPAIEKVREFLEKIKEKWEELDPETQDMIVKIGLIVAALGPVIMIVGTLVTAIGALMSPIGLVVLAIGAAIAAGIALYQNWDEICAWAKELKDRVIEAWENIKSKVTEKIEELKRKISEKWEAIKEKVSTTVDQIRESVSEKWEAIKEKVRTTVENIRETISEKFEAAKEKVIEIWENVKEKTSSVWGAIKETIDENGGGIQGIIATVAEGMKVAWEEGLQFLNEITGGKLGEIYDWFTEKLEAIKNFVQDKVDWLKGIFDFEWSLPHISLPHFSWSWIDLGGIVSIPQISVEWYKKAYDTPYLFTDPTVIAGKGFGDGGGSGEIVYGRDQLMRDIAEVASGEITINVYANDNMDIRQLADEVQQRLALVQRQKASAYA